MDPPAIDEDTARTVLEPGSHDIGDAVEYGDLLLRKVEEQRADGDIEREYDELVDDETGEPTGERIGAHHYAVNDYEDLREDLVDRWFDLHWASGVSRVDGVKPAQAYFSRPWETGCMSERDTPVPVTEGEEYVFDVEEIGREGDGVGYVDDFAVLVPEADMGDQVRVEIERVEPEFAMATVLEHESDVA